MKSSAAPTGATDLDVEEREAFALRMAEATKGLKLVEIAKAAGISPSGLQRYLGGSMPAADIGFRLARALDVRPEWLIEGREPKNHDATPLTSDAQEVVTLPRYDPHAFGEYGKGAVVDHIGVPTSWLLSSVRTTSGLWLADMPNDAFPEFAKEGETMICKDADIPLQDRRIYIFMLDGRPIVRRVTVTADGLLLKTDRDEEGMLVRKDELDRLMPAGRVLAAISLNPA